jgi:hypothetical protein
VSTSDLYGKAYGMLEEPTIRTPFSSARPPCPPQREHDGQHGGVGIQIDIRDGWVIVVSAPLVARRSVPASKPAIASSTSLKVHEGLGDRRNAQHASRCPAPP